MIFYVYGYSDPTSPYPYFYIGKGKDDRYLEHFQWHLLKQNTHFYNRLRSLLLKNVIPIVTFLKSNLTEKQALSFEIEMIIKYGRLDLGTGCLCNLTEGGDGTSGSIHSDETKEKIRKKRALQFISWLDGDHKVAISNSVSKHVQTSEARKQARVAALADRGRRIHAINLLTNEIVMTFDCIRDVVKKGFQRSNVQKVLAGSRQHANGYGWRYAE